MTASARVARWLCVYRLTLDLHTRLRLTMSGTDPRDVANAEANAGDSTQQERSVLSERQRGGGPAVVRSGDEFHFQFVIVALGMLRAKGLGQTTMPCQYNPIEL